MNKQHFGEGIVIENEIVLINIFEFKWFEIGKEKNPYHE